MNPDEGKPLFVVIILVWLYNKNTGIVNITYPNLCFARRFG